MRPRHRTRIALSRSIPVRGTACLGGLILTFLSIHASADEELFESKIRPLFIESCSKCHGAKSQKGGVRLDNPRKLLANSDGEAIIVPGKPEASRLVAVLRHKGEIRMPPKRPLSQEKIATVVEWIRRGAVRPAAGSIEKKTSPTTDPKEPHWAFQPITAAAPPKTDSDWALDEVDRFVAAKLESAKLAPSPATDKASWLRRVTMTFTGLPPKPEDLDSFLEDDHPDAFEKVVDRLLASPRFGERWGRHWLDVARYADTKGYVFTSERRFPFSFTFRDYVIRSFNQDLPYDQFVVEQLAADQIEEPRDPRALAAMGFLTLGRRFLNNPHDIIDDRIDVTTRGLMSLTVQCARCHDHKYDPIPTKDYYSLYGVFASSQEPKDLPKIGPPEGPDLISSFEKELAKQTEVLEDYRDKKHVELVAGIRANTGAYLAAIAAGKAELPESYKSIAGKHAIVSTALARWKQRLAVRAKPGDPVFGAWHSLVTSKPDSVETAFGAWKKSPAHQMTNRYVREALVELDPKRREDVVAAYSNAFRRVLEAKQIPTGEHRSPHEALRSLLFAENAPSNLPLDLARRHFGRDVRDHLRKLQNRVDRVSIEHAGAPLRAMTLVDRPSPSEPYVFRRGQAGNRGERVPRQFLEVLSRDERKPFSKGSGRLELARAIASADNPLTPRSIVNRIWMHHFGQALVRTPADFGIRSDPPTHPKLLDFLASRLIADGWSLKLLHRRLALSATYRQSSVVDPAKHAIDPDNRFLWRTNPRRVEFEALRDSMLHAAAKLDLRSGGKSVDLFRRPYTTRRTVYGYIDRQNLPQTLRNFDFASPDATSPKRHETTVPQQALWLMNGAFAQEQARAVVARADFQALKAPRERVEFLYTRLFARPAHEDEHRAAVEFLRASGATEHWERYVQALFLTNEFTFVD